MNIILFEEGELRNNSLLLTDHRAKHVVKVLRSKIEDILRVGILGGAMGTAVVANIHRKYPFAVELSVNLTDIPDPAPAIDLLLALPRPIMLKRILSQVTALGVGQIFIINASRVEKSFWEAGILEPEEYRPHLIHGLEQAVDTIIPALHIRRHFRHFVEDELPAMAKNYAHFLLAHPGGTRPLATCMQNRRGSVLYAIGPEGGWVDSEVETFMRVGMESFSIGSRILKVDTAVIAIHSRIAQELERI